MAKTFSGSIARTPYVSCVSIKVQDQTRVWTKDYSVLNTDEGLQVNDDLVSLEGEQSTRHLLLSLLERLAPEDDGTVYLLDHSQATELHCALRDAVVNRYESEELMLVPVNSAGLALAPEVATIKSRPTILKTKEGLVKYKFVDRDLLGQAKQDASALGRPFSADMVEGLDLGRNNLYESLVGWFKFRYPGSTVLAGDFNNGIMLLSNTQPECTPEDAQKAYRLLKRPGVNFKKPVNVVYLSMASTELNGPLGLVLNEFALADCLGFLPGNFQGTVDKKGTGKGCVFIAHSKAQYKLEALARAKYPNADLLVNIDELKKYLGDEAPAHGTEDVLYPGQITFMGSQDYNGPTRANISVSTMAKLTGDNDFNDAAYSAGKSIVSKGFKALMSGDIQACVKLGILPRFGVFKSCADLGLPGIPARLQDSFHKGVESWLLKLLNGIALPAYRRYLGASEDIKENEVLVPADLWEKFKPIMVDGKKAHAVVPLLSHPMQGNKTYGKLKVVGCTDSEVFVVHPKVLARLRRDNDGDSGSLFIPQYLAVEETHFPKEDVEEVSVKKDKSQASSWSIRSTMEICKTEQALIGWASDLATNAQLDAIAQDALPEWESLLSKPSSNFMQGTLSTVKHNVFEQWKLSHFVDLLGQIRKDYGFGAAKKEEFCSFFNAVKVRRNAKHLEEALPTLEPGTTAAAVARWDNYLRPLVERYLDEKGNIPLLKASTVKDILSTIYYRISYALMPVFGEAGLEDEMIRLQYEAAALWEYHKLEVKKQVELGEDAQWDHYRKALAKKVRALTAKLISKEGRLLFVMMSIRLRSAAKDDDLAVTYLATLCREFGIAGVFRKAVEEKYTIGDLTQVTALTTDTNVIIRTGRHEVGINKVRALYHSFDESLPSTLQCTLTPWTDTNVAFSRKKGDTRLVLAHEGIVVAVPNRSYAELMEACTEKVFLLDTKTWIAFIQ